MSIFWGREEGGVYGNFFEKKETHAMRLYKPFKENIDDHLFINMGHFGGGGGNERYTSIYRKNRLPGKMRFIASVPENDDFWGKIFFWECFGIIYLEGKIKKRGG